MGEEVEAEVEEAVEEEVTEEAVEEVVEDWEIESPKCVSCGGDTAVVNDTQIICKVCLTRTDRG